MPPELDNMEPGMGAGQEVVGLQGGEADREGAMAKADLYKLANYAHKLFQNLDDSDQLEGWVQAKITKAADYIASVYHYLEYEMKFSEYGKALDDSDVLSESQKLAIKTRLMEAKNKVAELKKAQASKLKHKHDDKALEEGILSGGETHCPECGGSGVVMMPERQVPEATKEKVAKYNRLMKAAKAAHKRMDANNNGIPDDEEMEEGQDELKKTGDSYKTARGGTVTKTKSGLKHEKGDYSDDEHVEPAQKKASKAGLTGAERRDQKSQDKAQEKAGKDWEKRFGKGSVTRHKAGGDDKKDESVAEGKKGDGNLANNAKPYDKVTRGDVIAGRLGKDEEGGKKKVKEAAPSADLSKKEKSEVVKKAKKGEDIGKPGKGFKKVADKAAEKYGSKKKGEKVAAAAMWKNIKETMSYIEEKKEAVKDLPGNQEKIDVNKNGKIDGDDLAKLRAGKKETVKESTELTRMQDQVTRLTRGSTTVLKESSEAEQIRELTKRLLG